LNGTVEGVEKESCIARGRGAGPSPPLKINSWFIVNGGDWWSWLMEMIDVES
jgi:hypothetical protein